MLEGALRMKLKQMGKRLYSRLRINEVNQSALTSWLIGRIFGTHAWASQGNLPFMCCFGLVGRRDLKLMPTGDIRLFYFPLILSVLVYALTGCNSLPKEASASLVNVLSESKIESMLKDAELAYKTQRWAEAQQQFSLVLANDKENQFALYRLGNLAFKEGKVNEAAQYYETLLGLNSAHSRSHYNLGICRLIQARRHLQNFVLMKDPASNTDALEQVIKHINSFAASQSN